MCNSSSKGFAAIHAIIHFLALWGLSTLLVLQDQSQQFNQATANSDIGE